MPKFSPPTIKLPVGKGPLLGRYTFDKGVSVVLVEGQYVSIPYVEDDTIRPLVDGVDYFLGGHGPYEVTDEVALALQASGYAVEGDPVDPFPVPGDVSIISAQMPNRTSLSVTWTRPAIGGPIDGYNVYINDILVAIKGPAELTHNQGGLAVSTEPEQIFVLKVKAFNEDEEGEAANTWQLQWNVVVIPPDPPVDPPDPLTFGDGGFGSGLFGDDTGPNIPTEDDFGAGPFGDGPFGD